MNKHEKMVIKKMSPTELWVIMDFNYSPPLKPGGYTIDIMDLARVLELDKYKYYILDYRKYEKPDYRLKICQNVNHDYILIVVPESEADSTKVKAISQSFLRPTIGMHLENLMKFKFKWSQISTSVLTARFSLEELSNSVELNLEYLVREGILVKPNEPIEAPTDFSSAPILFWEEF